MNKVNQGIWNCDLYGKVREKIGGHVSIIWKDDLTIKIIFQGEGESQFIQAAGLAFDNNGNFLAICSKTSRISAFRADGSFMCDVSDISDHITPIWS